VRRGVRVCADPLTGLSLEWLRTPPPPPPPPPPTPARRHPPSPDSLLLAPSAPPRPVSQLQFRPFGPIFTPAAPRHSRSLVPLPPSRFLQPPALPAPHPVSPAHTLHRRTRPIPSCSYLFSFIFRAHPTNRARSLIPLKPLVHQEPQPLGPNLPLAERRMR
jgi:hypothetical protein